MGSVIPNIRLAGAQREPERGSSLRAMVLVCFYLSLRGSVGPALVLGDLSVCVSASLCPSRSLCPSLFLSLPFALDL